MICFRHCKALVFWIDRAKHPLRGKRLFSIFGQLFKKASSVVRQLVENSCLRSLKTFVHCTRSKDFKTILLFHRQSNCLRQFLLTWECSSLLIVDGSIILSASWAIWIHSVKIKNDHCLQCIHSIAIASHPLSSVDGQIHIRLTVKFFLQIKMIQSRNI